MEGCNSTDQKESKSLELKIIPSPNKVLNRGGEIVYSKDFRVIADVSDSTTSELASFLASRLKSLTSQDVLITDLYSTRKHNQSIRIKINAGSEDLQGYSLDLSSAQIKIDAGSSQGIYYGIQSLVRLFNSVENSDSTYTLPKVIIKDSPSNKIRALLFSSAQIEGEYKILSLIMGMLKFNKLIIENNQETEIELKKLMAKNFIHVSNLDELDSNIPLISIGDSLEDLEQFYTTYKASSNNAEFVLDLRFSSNSVIYNKLIIMSEISWTNSNKKSFDELKESFQSTD